jgi:hypothetical protein
MRQAEFDTLSLPLPADPFVYSEEEAASMEKTSAWFQGIVKDTLWILPAAT